MVSKKKNNNDTQFKAYLLAWQYIKIPVDAFTKNYSSLVSDVTLCAILLMWLIKSWGYQIIYVKTEFYLQL